MNIIEFTIKNFDLRIEKCMNTIKWNKIKLKYEDEREEAQITINKQNALIEGYENAQLALRNNSKLTKENVEYILKSLKIRNKKLNENLAQCKKTIETEEKALKTGKYEVDYTSTGLGIATEHYPDVSERIIAESKRRINNITRSLELCTNAIKFFEDYLV